MESMEVILFNLPTFRTFNFCLRPSRFSTSRSYVDLSGPEIPRSTHKTFRYRLLPSKLLRVDSLAEAIFIKPSI